MWTHATIRQGGSSMAQSKKKVGKKMVAQKKANKKKAVDKAKSFNDTTFTRDIYKSRKDVSAKNVIKHLDKLTAAEKKKVKAKQAKAKAKSATQAKAKTKRSAAKKGKK